MAQNEVGFQFTCYRPQVFRDNETEIEYMKLLDLLAVSHPEEELDGPTVHTFLTAFEAVAP
ncbi:MAG: hypothetical protein AAB901_02565, partial [Patescibacteria group bacterium]